jgi:hypothetical protein
VALRSDYDSKNLSFGSKYTTTDIYDHKYCNFITLTFDIDLIKTRAIHWKYFLWSSSSIKDTEREFGFTKRYVSCMATVKLYLPSLPPMYTCHALKNVKSSLHLIKRNVLNICGTVKVKLPDFKWRQVVSSNLRPVHPPSPGKESLVVTG